MGVTLKILLARRRVGATLVLAIGLISMGALLPRYQSDRFRIGFPLTDPAKIEKLAKDAYTGGSRPSSSTASRSTTSW